MQRYHNPAMKQLTDQQVRYAPREKRLEQVSRAETFLAELDLNESYRYQDVCHRITNYRSELYPDLYLTGKEAMHDLRCFMEDLSDSANLMPEEVEEPVLTVQEVSERFNVSTKTVDRWRNRGLASRRFLFGKRKRIGFLESSVKRFAASHQEEIHRGSRFSQLSLEEKEDIIAGARKLAHQGGCPSEISRLLAEELGRSPETIRYTLKNYDETHPENAIFPYANRTLTDELREEIYRRYKRGVTLARLTKEFARSKNSIHRIISVVRANRLKEQEIEFMESEDFHKKKADQLILGEAPEPNELPANVKTPPGLPPYLKALYSIPLLTKEEEVYYFRKMNYLKFRASEMQEKLNAKKPRVKLMEKMEDDLKEALDIKNFLIRSNLRLVVSIAKKHINPNTNFFEMVSDGNISLMRAIEKFDYSRGNKFSTYASWAIMKNYARSIPAEHTRLDRFRTGTDEIFSQSEDERSNAFQQELVNERQHELIMSILDQLDEREREIIIYRFGLEHENEPQTLEQVGFHFGVTKERIRQLESRALKKLKKIAQQEKLDIPGI